MLVASPTVSVAEPRLTVGDPASEAIVSLPPRTSVPLDEPETIGVPVSRPAEPSVREPALRFTVPAPAVPFKDVAPVLVSVPPPRVAELAIVPPPRL